MDARPRGCHRAEQHVSGPGAGLDTGQPLRDEQVHDLRLGESAGATQLLQSGADMIRDGSRGILLFVRQREAIPIGFVRLHRSVGIVGRALGRQLGVRLVPSPEAEAGVEGYRGMRHTAGRRYSYDDSAATVIVVSEDGPVSVLRNGKILGASPISEDGHP